MIHTSSIEFLNAKEPIIQRTNIIGIKYFVLTLIAFKKKGMPIKVRIIKNNTETAVLARCIRPAEALAGEHEVVGISRACRERTGDEILVHIQGRSEK